MAGMSMGFTSKKLFERWLGHSSGWLGHAGSFFLAAMNLSNGRNHRGPMPGHSILTGQRPHVTAGGHAKTLLKILKEVKEQA